MADDVLNKKPINLTGHFLVAEAELGDPNFSETVVLIISHDDEGAFGLVVNRRSDISLGQAAEPYTNSPFAGLPLFVGGPVEQEFLFCLHSGLPDGNDSPYVIKLTSNLVFEPQFVALETHILANPKLKPPEIRLFAGYSGWTAGQLESELEEGAWMTMPASSDLVFNPHPQGGWKQALKRKGGVYWLVAETGYKPSLN